MKKYHKDARKYFVDKYNLDIDMPYIDVANFVLEKHQNKILVDFNLNKEKAGQLLYMIFFKFYY